MDTAVALSAPAVEKRLNPFERFLTLWVGLCMVAGVLLGRAAPELVQALRSMEFGEGSHINFPIALLSAGALAELLYLRTRRSMWRTAGAYCVVLGGVGAVVAAALGWASAGFTLVDKDTIRLIHRWLGTGVAVVSVAAMGTVSLTGASDQAAGSTETPLAPRVLVLLAGLSAMAAGFFGGAIVWGLDHYGL